ncbi:hypothetical protein K466DRAFT_601766 [Polyporus arcularius HHB13444]|uniref:Uncharacterized protein n=1 Tax=Polyporus arcularius HHB13444 TaxID=1314778 RepID=A0A5C3P847_9APHY|nr:hypothetical protein K466DRAFT_601766 [Polyporus arcularius HHB13444]
MTADPFGGVRTTASEKIFMTVDLVAVPTAEAGPLAYGRCNALAVACYGAAGAVFGTVTATVGVAPAIIGCNAALGTVRCHRAHRSDSVRRQTGYSPSDEGEAHGGRSAG